MRATIVFTDSKGREHRYSPEQFAAASEHVTLETRVMQLRTLKHWSDAVLQAGAL